MKTYDGIFETQSSQCEKFQNKTIGILEFFLTLSCKIFLKFTDYLQTFQISANYQIHQKPMSNLSGKSVGEYFIFFIQTMNNFSIMKMPFFTHFNYSIVCLKSFHMRNIFKLFGSWHFHQKPTRFLPNWPTWPIWGSSQSVCLVVEEVYHVPSPCLFFKASHWPSDHMIIWRLQAQWIGPIIFFSCWMDTFKGCKHSELGPSSSSLAGWTHLKAASTVKWARHFLLLLDGHI